MLTYLGILSGVTAVLIQVTGYALAIRCFLRARNKKNSRLVIYGLFFACMATFFLGPTVDLISVLVFDENINYQLLGQLSYTLTQPCFALGMYIGVSLLKPARARLVFFIYLLSSLLFIPFLFIGNNIVQNFLPGSPPPPPGQRDLVDVLLTNIPGILAFIDLLGLAIVFLPSFWWFAITKKGQGLPRKKAAYIALGFTLFFICGLLDSLLPFDYFVGYVRIGMAVGYICLYKGFTI